jgi:transcriptional regulator with XRE-family HTH domain
MDITIFKDRLKIAMADAHINGAELADACGTSRSSICRYLQGERIPKANTITKMADVLQVSVFWLLGDDNVSPVKSKNKIPKYNPIDYSKLTYANKLRIQGYYQALLDTQTKNSEII